MWRTRLACLAPSGATLLPLAGLQAALVAAGRVPALAPPPLAHLASRLGPWAASRPALWVAEAILRQGALALGWALCALTGAHCLAGLAGSPAWARAVGALTPAWWRLALAGVAAVLPAAPAAAARAPALPPGAARLSGPPPPGARIAPSGPPGPPARLPEPPPAPAPQAAWVVAPGQSFWAIAAQLASARLGRPATDAEVAACWLPLMAANAGRLVVPRDFNLILPGQVLALPPPS